MMKLRTALATLLILIGSAFNCAQAANTWIRAESEHFVVYSNLGAKTASAYLQKLEQFRYVLASLSGLVEEKETRFPKLPVYFVRSDSDRDETFPGTPYPAAGYFEKCVEGQFALVVYDAGENFTDEDWSQTVLFHEYTHNFMYQLSDKVYPNWFVEGFAEYYSTVRLTEDSAMIGMPLTDDFRILNDNVRSMSYETLLRNTWLPEHGEPSPEQVAAFYAQSWLLTDYIFADATRRKQLAAYMEAYRRGDDPVAAFESAFGITLKDLPGLLKVFMLKAKAYKFRIDRMPKTQVTVSILPVSADKLLLLDAGARCSSEQNRPTILARIRDEASKYPEDDYAKRTLARAEIVLGDEWKALDYLKAQIAARPDDADAQFMLGQAWLLSTTHKHIQPGESEASQISAARKALGLGYKLDPLNAADLYYYSLALKVHKQIASENRLSAALQAHFLAPSVHEYALQAAYLLAEHYRMDEAKAVLEPLTGDPHAPADWLGWLKDIIATINRHAGTEEVLAAFHGTQH